MRSGRGRSASSMKVWLLTSEEGLKRVSPRALVERASERGIALTPIIPERCALEVSRGALEVFHEGALLPLPDAAFNYRVAFGNHLTFTLSRQLEAAGVLVVSSTSSALLGRDKAAALQRFAAAGLPIPRTTLLPLSRDLDPKFHARELPVIVKTAMGSQGREVFLCENLSQLRKVVANLERSLEPGQSVLLQELVRTSPARDFRVTVVGGQAVGASAREARAGGWKTNLAGGGRCWECPLDDEMARLAIEACEVLGLDLGGVDLLMGRDGYLLNEVNPAPQFRVDHPDSPRSFDVPDRLFELVERRLAERA